MSVITWPPIDSLLSDRRHHMAAHRGRSAELHPSRPLTPDDGRVNLRLESDDEILRQIPTPKERLGLNVELASPASRLTFRYRRALSGRAALGRLRRRPSRSMTR